MKKRFGLFALMAVYASMNHLEVAASLEGYEDFRNKIGYQSADSDEEEDSPLMGPGVHTTFRLQRGETHEGLRFDFEVALKGLDIFDQNLARAAVATPTGCPNWSLLPMDTDAGRVRAGGIARILTDHYTDQKNKSPQGAAKQAWLLKATTLGVSYRKAWERGERAQKEAESSCCSLCCLFFY
ncbi:MAG: hypothetical protein LCH26_04045 [Proteobacteria bacterium]|nr:hypothetical protein [Pseudomonadota bacterium]